VGHLGNVMKIKKKRGFKQNGQSEVRFRKLID